MTTSETVTTAGSGPFAAEAAEAAAHEAATEVPKERVFIDRLPCELSEEKHVKYAQRYVAKRREVDAFDAATKKLVAERKTKRAELVAEVDDLEEIVNTGRVERDVRCIEYTSFAQNRRWIVRTDKTPHEQIDEQPLSAQERQTTLDLPDDGAQTKLPIDDGGASTEVDAATEEAGDGDAGGLDLDPNDADEASFGDLSSAALDSTTNIDDPDALLDAKPSKPAKKRSKD